MKTDFVRELREALRAEHAVETEFGLFFTERLAGWEGANPKTGQVISVPGKVMPIFLPSDAFSKAIIEGPFLTSDQIWKENFDRKDPPPVATKKLASKGIYQQVVAELRQQGSSVLHAVGMFSVRDFVYDDPDRPSMKVVLFAPSDDLRNFLNSSA